MHVANQFVGLQDFIDLIEPGFFVGNNVKRRGIG
jgi:hypothetical protein